MFLYGVSVLNKGNGVTIFKVGWLFFDHLFSNENPSCRFAKFGKV